MRIFEERKVQLFQHISRYFSELMSLLSFELFSQGLNDEHLILFPFAFFNKILKIVVPK